MKQSGFGIASLVLGILGFLSSCMVFGIVPSTIGLILAIIGMCAKDRAKGTAIAGLILSILGIGISLCALLVGFAVLEDDSSGGNSTKIEKTESDVKQIETLLIEDENLSVYLDHIENGKIYIKYENHSDTNINIQYSDLTINGTRYYKGIFVDEVYSQDDLVKKLSLYDKEGKTTNYNYESGTIKGKFEYFNGGIGFTTELEFDEIEF